MAYIIKEDHPAYMDVVGDGQEYDQFPLILRMEDYCLLGSQTISNFMFILHLCSEDHWEELYSKNDFYCHRCEVRIPDEVVFAAKMTGCKLL
jgi:hypothetical protein